MSIPLIGVVVAGAVSVVVLLVAYFN